VASKASACRSGNDRLIAAHCGKVDWTVNRYVVATENVAVSAEWINGGANNVQDANSGYEFWIFDPNGSYSYRRFRSHNVSDGKSPANANRACHMKINGWFNSALTRTSLPTFDEHPCTRSCER
jgi:hypothetical protein